MEYPFIAITPRSILIQSGSTRYMGQMDAFDIVIYVKANCYN